MEYRVTWEIDVEAEDEAEAARAAMRYQHADTTANVFYVEQRSGDGGKRQRFGKPRGVKVDLGDIPRGMLTDARGAARLIPLEDVEALLSDLRAGVVRGLDEVRTWCEAAIENAAYVAGECAGIEP